jgi:adenylyltransferase/sulfurtransferase
MLSDTHVGTRVSVPKAKPISDVSLKEILAHPSDFKPDRDTFIVCRLGNDSQLAAAALRGVAGKHVVQDLVGGLVSWAAQADSTFPVY